MEIKKFVVVFYHEGGYFSQYCPEPIYLTKKGLDSFLTKFKKELIDMYIGKFNIVENDCSIKIDYDFVVSWGEYLIPEEPKFLDFIPEYLELSISNGGYGDTCMSLYMYD